MNEHRHTSVLASRATSAKRSAREDTLAAERTPLFSALVRTGFVGRGITYGLIGALALALAIGAGSRPASPDQQGALTLITRAPVGWLALALIALGLLAYAAWKLGQAVFGTGPEGGGGARWSDRVANLAGGLAYLAFFAVAIRVLIGSGGSETTQQQHTAAGVLGWPGGRLIVAIAAAVLIAVSAYQGYQGARGEFADDNKLTAMSAFARRLFLTLGRVGMVARALVFLIVGYFLLRAAIDFNPDKVVGVDGALGQVHRQPFGPWLLGIVAAGLMVFALFSFAEARYRRL